MNADLKVSRFSKSLRRARRDAGEPSYRDLARQTGYSISSISRILNGKNFPGGTSPSCSCGHAGRRCPDQRALAPALARNR
jgi:hypothetical protein